jgi:hypothetical protein
LHWNHLERWVRNFRAARAWSFWMLDAAAKPYARALPDLGILETFRADFVDLAFADLDSAPVKTRLARLIEEREYQIKGARSRFEDLAAPVSARIYEPGPYERYLFDFRWSVGRDYAIDVLRGLRS